MNKLKDLKKRLQFLKEKLKPEKLKKEIRLLSAKAAKPDFWQDQEKAGQVMKKLAHFKKEIEEIEKLEEDLKEERIEEAEKKLKKIELKLFLSDRYDASPALLSIHAGQGGVEAMDWAQMLERMYIKYFEKKDWTFEVLDETFGEEAGIKNATLAINEPFAYGFLKFEAGTHRLVRQSPFNADRLRQTSFALVEVLPQIEGKEEVQVNEDDLEWQFFRASTQGGQNVQKVSPAVRLRHKPTGMVVTCQTQRRQEQNRKIAQIRSYVLHPYKLVKDLRTDLETQEAESVLDGDLEEFIQTEIRSLSKSSDSS
jgi:peptide chain release factor 2